MILILLKLKWTKYFNTVTKLTLIAKLLELKNGYNKDSHWTLYIIKLIN